MFIPFSGFIQSLPPQLAVFLLAMTPIIELRVALPVALLVYDIPIIRAVLLAVIGNIVPAFLILYGWDRLVTALEKSWPWLGLRLGKWHDKVQGQWDKKIERYGPWALAFFVAIPVPGSGVWTGSVAAWIFGIDKRHALWAILAGSVLSAFLVTIITFGGVSFLGF